MMEKLNLYNDLRKIQTLLNCMEGNMIRATAGNVNDAPLESLDLLYLLQDHDGRMVDSDLAQDPAAEAGAP